MKILDLGFRSSVKGSVHHLKLNYVDSELDKAAVQQAMQKIAGLNMFADKSGDQIYAKPVSASYIDEQETVLFDEDQD